MNNGVLKVPFDVTIISDIDSVAGTCSFSVHKMQSRLSENSLLKYFEIHVVKSYFPYRSVTNDFDSVL